MLNNLPFYMLRSLACTLVIEIIFALILGMRKKGDILTVALVNVMTNPLVVSLGFISGFFFGTKVRIICTVFLELFAFASEGIAYRYALRYKKLNPFLLSLLLNAASYLSGFIINSI